MSEAERSLYEAGDEYVSTTYKRTAKAERSAVEFGVTDKTIAKAIRWLRA